MLQELRDGIKAREEFLAAYLPVRKTIENFLQRGEKYPGNPIFKFLTSFDKFAHGFVKSADSFIDPGDRPFWKREVEATIDDLPVILSAETDRILYPKTAIYSHEIDKATIIFTVQSSQAPGLGRVVVLPSLWAIDQNAFKSTMYENVLNRLKDVLPHIPQQN